MLVQKVHFSNCIFHVVFFCSPIVPHVDRNNKVCLCLHNDIRALIHACVCVCGLRGGGGRCLASGSGPLCMFVFVICVTARRFSLPLTF